MLAPSQTAYFCLDSIKPNRWHSNSLLNILGMKIFFLRHAKWSTEISARALMFFTAYFSKGGLDINAITKPGSCRFAAGLFIGEDFVYDRRSAAFRSPKAWEMILSKKIRLDRKNWTAWWVIGMCLEKWLVKFSAVFLWEALEHSGSRRHWMPDKQP